MNKLLPVLLGLALAGLLTYGMPPISRDYNLHCRCAEVESRVIPPAQLTSLQIFPQDAHCHNTEIIAGLTNGEKVCLDSRSVWVTKLIRFVLKQHASQPQPLQNNSA